MATTTANLLRRIALDAQGLTRSAPFGRGVDATRRALEQLGYVQIDTISIVTRAHHHTLWNRIPNYRPSHLDRLVSERHAFEHWFHAAAYLPMRDYRFALPLMHAIRNGERSWFRSNDMKLVRAVVARVRAEGPLMARDFDAPKKGGSSGWWNWKPAKRALEQLFMQGDLMIAGRKGFQKVYDLAERVLPPDVDTTKPTTDEYAAHLLDAALRAHGFASQKEITYGRPGTAIRRALRARLDADVSDRTLVRIDGNGGQYFARPETLDRRSRASGRVRLLSPFDNSIIQRDRNLAIHDFDYRLECYVPVRQRRFGYFCLPILYRDRFVGRADCRAHRSERRFDVVHLHVERDIVDRERFLAALAEAVREFAAFNDCDDLCVVEVSPSSWNRAVRKALEAGV